MPPATIDTDQETPGHLIITGASGYIGRRLLQIARDLGYRVTVLGRGPAALPWRLGDGLPAAALTPSIQTERHAVIHLAHDWTTAGTASSLDSDLNVTGTLALLQDCRDRGISRFVFVSSQSAQPDAANHYGKVKWRIERELRNSREIAVRVGLVYGGVPHGLFAVISRLIKYFPVLPMIMPGRPVQPIHVDEAARGLIRAAQGHDSGWIGLACPTPITFGSFLRIVAAEQYGKRLRILPIPLGLALAGSMLTRVLPGLPRIDRERILGFAGLRSLECDGHVQRLGIDISPVSAALRRDPLGRKAALREGQVLLRYVIGSPAGSSLLRRYARASPPLNEGYRLLLPATAWWWPGVLRWLEPFNRTGCLARRLDLATALAAASPEGEHALDRTEATRFSRLACLAWALMIEVAALPVRLVLGRRQR
jgi:nucleoside-diphosphate-sugar epimerase